MKLLVDMNLSLRWVGVLAEAGIEAVHWSLLGANNAQRHTGPKKNNICYATQNRQDAVKALAPQYDVVIVVGSPTSSNSNRLREVATNLGVPAYMVDNASEIDPQWIAGKQNVGVTAGASAPEILVRAVIERLTQLGIGAVTDLDGVQEKVGFPLPKGLG